MDSGNLSTFWLTLGGCGSAVLAAAFPGVGIGLLGVSLAFGLIVVTGAYAFGPTSGGHFNPAMSIGLLVGKRFSIAELPGYIIAQVRGALAASALLYLIVSGKTGFSGVGGFATNNYNTKSPGGFNVLSVLVTEVAMTAIFLIVILVSTAKKAAGGFGGLATGLCLILIHLVSIPVYNTSVNPASSTGQALFAQTGAMGDLWLFWVAPIAGAVLVAMVYRLLMDDES